MSGDKKLIYFLVAVIIFFSIILLVKIKTKPEYDTRLYNEIYDEYKNIFEENNNLKNIQADNDIEEKNNNQTINVENISSNITLNNTDGGNIIGKIIIPKIDIRYPIIKETTTEYLKIAPTKYCGPELNEIRKFSYSRT